MNEHATQESLRLAAGKLGFPLFGITSAQLSPGFVKFCQWLDLGYAGSMKYLNDRREAYRHPSSILADIETIIILGMPYSPASSRRKKSPPLVESISGVGRVAAYASGTLDYHDLIFSRLKELGRELQKIVPGCRVRGVVDTAPLPERDFAILAGLGWRGKNTLLLNRNAGSYFFLAGLLIDAVIPHSTALETDHCGTCRACLDACPTQAFPQPYVLDASKCISYWTIEHRGQIPVEVRPKMDDWIFGCDVCQQVCPWNRMASPTQESGLQTQDDRANSDIVELLKHDDTSFRKAYRKTPIWRTKRIGMQRNAIIVAGNLRLASAVLQLKRHLDGDEPILRTVAAWAIGQIANRESMAILKERLTIEEDPDVLRELGEAILKLQSMT